MRKLIEYIVDTGEVVAMHLSEDGELVCQPGRAFIEVSLLTSHIGCRVVDGQLVQQTESPTDLK